MTRIRTRLRRRYMTLPACIDAALELLPGALLIFGGLLTIGLGLHT